MHVCPCICVCAAAHEHTHTHMHANACISQAYQCFSLSCFLAKNITVHSKPLRLQWLPCLPPLVYIHVHMHAYTHVTHALNTCSKDSSSHLLERTITAWIKTQDSTTSTRLTSKHEAQIHLRLQRRPRNTQTRSIYDIHIQSQRLNLPTRHTKSMQTRSTDVVPICMQKESMHTRLIWSVLPDMVQKYKYDVIT